MIRFEFESVLQAGLWILENFPHIDRALELDRIDNDGPYAPGNIRLVPRKVNQGNRRITRIPEWCPEDWPYAYTVVSRYTREGKSREDILELARLAVAEKRKNWRQIARWLESTTSSMRDRNTDSDRKSVV